MNFWKCVAYLAMIGVLSHFVGEGMPRGWFHPERRPWKPMRFEHDGRIYDRLNIREWKDKLPDMSRILPDMVPKRIVGLADAEQLHVLSRETCVAELTHVLLMAAGFICVRIWPGWGGVLVSVAFALGNLPYILIQRYNRPRFVRLALWLDKRGAPAHVQQNKNEVLYENSDTDM